MHFDGAIGSVGCGRPKRIDSLYDKRVWGLRERRTRECACVYWMGENNGRTDCLAYAMKNMASIVDRGIGSPPAPGAASAGSWAAIAAASPWDKTNVSRRVAESPRQSSLSLPGLLSSQIASESMCRV